MEKRYLICPNCHARLYVDASKPLDENKLLICPVCKAKALIANFLGGTFQRGGLGSDDAPTQVPPPHPSASKGKGQIRILKTGQTCPLNPGRNVIGRLAETSKADIKICQEDKYMSRQHIQIDVIEHGGNYQHKLTEINSTNITHLNGKPLNRGDVLYIKFGDKLTLGTTEVIFEDSSDEATKIIL